MMRACPKCKSETGRPPVAGKMRCFTCGNRWDAESAPAEAGSLDLFFAELRRLDATITHLQLGAKGGSVQLAARGVVVDFAAATDAELATGAVASLDACLVVLDRRPA